MKYVGERQSLDRLIRMAIERGDIPGAVLIVGCRDCIVFQGAYGNRALYPQVLPMEVETVFDLASLTKPVACATAILLLAERGVLSLTDPVAKYVPAFGTREKRSITIEHLLFHTSGLLATSPLADCIQGLDTAAERIATSELVHKPGTDFLYSDLGYIILGHIVAIVDHRGLAAFTRDEIFAPLGMDSTGYMPPANLRSRCASTGLLDGRWLTGEVHDPRASALGGVSGHAGLFATADDLTKFCRMIQNGGIGIGRRILSNDAVKRLIEPRQLPGAAGLRSLAFDVATRFSSPWAGLGSEESMIGHTGFTGTLLWLHPSRSFFAVLLSNSIHAAGGGRVTALRRDVLTLVAKIVQSGD